MLRLKAEALRKSMKEENGISLIDHFEHTGPKGKHLIVILELMWHNVHGVLDGHRDNNDAAMRITGTQAISKQIVKGFGFIHQCGAIHNGIYTSAQAF